MSVRYPMGEVTVTRTTGGGERRNPSWLLILLGWVFASTSLEWVSRRRAPDPGRARGSIDLQRSGARDLRRLPGIGPARAAAIVELRWERGAEGFELQEVRGIGPRTEARVMDALAAEGAPDRVDGRVDGRADGRADGRVDGRVEGRQ